MASNNIDEIVEFKIGDIFQSGDYIIPIYQRNYAWKEGQIVQLVNDIKDFALGSSTQPYYIGVLVVYKREFEHQIMYETIDGQQRLTTLSILYSVLKNEYDLGNHLAKFEGNILHFENRPLSINALNMAFNGKFHSSTSYNSSIEDAYIIIKKELQNLFGPKNNLNGDFEQFINYLNHQVILVRVEVPKETDLNHYFEIMNNRGEQLEKHEVLKSLLLSFLEKINHPIERENSKQLFNLIWEGCSQMERYIQYAFEKDQRFGIFGDHWDKLIVDDFDDLLSKVDFSKKNPDFELHEIENNDSSVSINTILADSKYANVISEGSLETAERFSSIINFQNFLLHCLLIQTKNKEATLDDKKLISHFDFLKNYSDSERIEFVKSFAFTILKLKFLLDQYVIKREYVNNKEGWSLKKLYLYNDKSQSYINSFGQEDSDTESRDLVLLLSMFHTVTPNMMYKYWLNASLNYLYLNYDSKYQINVLEYKLYLETFAKNLIYGRFLSKSSVEYFDIIYGGQYEHYCEENIDWEKLKYSLLENNLVFNYIDYLLLKEISVGNVFGIPSFSSFARSFEFTPRSSVEHYFPQNPKDASLKITDENILHSIGNLTLISHSKNSSMNNYLPKAKKEHYKNGAEADSIKQYLMFNKYPDVTWNINEILEHEDEIIKLLKNDLAISK